MNNPLFEHVKEVQGGWLAVINGVMLSIPDDDGNADCQALKAWINGGGEVEKASPPAWMSDI